jgi:hypothetical protein
MVISHPVLDGLHHEYGLVPNAACIFADHSRVPLRTIQQNPLNIQNIAIHDIPALLLDILSFLIRC